MPESVAIVTGAARGIGAATAVRLAAEGRAVAVLDLDEAACKDTVEKITAAGGKAIAVGATCPTPTQVEAAVARVADELGAPTVLVNNAGVLRDNLLFKMTEADWDTVMDVHLRGAFLMSRAGQKHMVDAQFGRIVNLSSTSALGNRGQANYSAAKAGLQGFTKTLAIELGKFGVTANAVAPGFIVTDMTAATAARVGMGFEEFQSAPPSRSRCSGSAGPRTSRTPSPSSPARARRSSPARSCTSPAARSTERPGPPARGRWAAAGTAGRAHQAATAGMISRPMTSSGASLPDVRPPCRSPPGTRAPTAGAGRRGSPRPARRPRRRRTGSRRS